MMKKQSKVKQTQKNDWIFELTIIIIDLIVVLAIIVLLEWLLFAFCSFNIYIKLVLAIAIFYVTIAFNGKIMSQCCTKKNPLYKGNDQP